MPTNRFTEQIEEVNGELKKLNRKIREWQDSIEELHDGRSKLEREIRRNEREVVEKNEELMEMNELRAFFLKKRGQLKSQETIEEAEIRQQAAAAAIAGITSIDEVSRDAPEKRQHLSPTSPVEESIEELPRPSLPSIETATPVRNDRSRSTTPSEITYTRPAPYLRERNVPRAAAPPAGIPAPPSPAAVSAGIPPPTARTQVVGPLMWECDGLKYYAEELKHMPVMYKFVNEYAAGCTFYVSGLDQRTKEFQAVELLATCMGRWPPRNCGVLALHILRKADWEAIEGTCIQGGAFIRVANHELANAFVYHMNGVTYKGRTLMVQSAQEFALMPSTKNPNLLGQRRYMKGVWNCPVEAQ